ncbi:MAG: endonuclease Q family protein [Halobacteriota archaeon]
MFVFTKAIVSYLAIYICFTKYQEMKHFDVDLHLHSRFSIGTSPKMDLPRMCETAHLKGVQVLGTGDCLQGVWIEELESSLEKRGDCYEIDGIAYVIQTEVETTVKGRVHHLILFPSFSSAHELRELVLSNGYSQLTGGRPQLKISPEELISLVREVDALAGPSHAFTPWTSMYAAYDSIRECYGENRDLVTFLELGLSADTKMASTLAELDSCTFVSFSDAHSAAPDKLGREFTRFCLRRPSFREICRAFQGVNGRGVVLNVGLDPREGKYHLTGCRRCKKAYDLEDITADGNVLKTCPECGGPLKIGVKDRIRLLALKSREVPLAQRPPYIHAVPLLEILKAMKRSNPMNVKKIYGELIREFDDEINILIDAPLGDVRQRHPELAKVLERFRNDAIDFEFVGRGGWYGKIKI